MMKRYQLMALGGGMLVLAACSPDESATLQGNDELTQNVSEPTLVIEEAVIADEADDGQKTATNPLSTALTESISNKNLLNSNKKLLDFYNYKPIRKDEESTVYLQPKDTSIFAITNVYTEPVKIIKDWSIDSSNFIRSFVFYRYR